MFFFSFAPLDAQIRIRTYEDYGEEKGPTRVQIPNLVPLSTARACQQGSVSSWSGLVCSGRYVDSAICQKLLCITVRS